MEHVSYYGLGQYVWRLPRQQSVFAFSTQLPVSAMTLQTFRHWGPSAILAEDQASSPKELLESGTCIIPNERNNHKCQRDSHH
jgi:hypothetical protein